MAAIQTKWVDVGLTTIYTTTVRGFDPTFSVGTMSNTADGASDSSINSVFSSTNVEDLYWYTNSSTTGIYFRINTLQSNSGFEKLIIGTEEYSRANATNYGQDTSAGHTIWQWTENTGTGGPYSTNPFGTVTGANIEVVFDDGVSLVAPVVNNTQNFSTTASQNISHTIALTSTGSGGTLEYNKSTTTTVPTTGWQSSATVTLTRGTSYYLWARQGVGYEDRTDTALLVPYLDPDTNITPISNINLLNDAIRFSINIEDGGSTTVYNVRSGSYSGTSEGFRLGTGLMAVNDAPLDNTTKTYYITARLPEASGGNNASFNIQTFTVTAGTTGISDSIDTLSGTSDAWTTKNLDLSDYADSNIRVLFHYTRGASFDGDIQLDDIQFGGNSYSFENATEGWETTLVQTPISNYETASFGTLGINTSTAGRWHVDNLGTPSSGTGRTDADDGTYYVYYEASGPNPGDGAFLRSPTVSLGSGTQTLSYASARAGGNIGTLKVLVYVEGPADRIPESYTNLAGNKTDAALSTTYYATFSTSVPGTTEPGTGFSIGTQVDNNTSISVSNGEYRIGSGSWTSAAGIVNQNETVYFRGTSSGSYGVQTTHSLTIGTVTRSFAIATLVTAPTDLTFSTATTASATTNVTVTASGGTGGTLQVSQDGTNWVANGTAFSKTRGINYTFYARRLGDGGSVSSSYSEAYSVPCTAPTGMGFSVASLTSPTENVTVTASGGYGGVLQVSEDNVNWDPDGTVYSKARGDSYVFYSRRVGDSGTESSVYTSSSFPVNYLAADTVVAATSSIIAYAAGSATTTISGVDRTTEEVAVRTNNGATNLGTRTGNGDITFTGSLPAAGAVTTYEIFTRRPTATGGDGTTWTATNDTFTVEQTPSAPTSISRTYAFTASPTTTVTVTASGGTGGTLQVSDDNSTWVANGTAFTVTRGSSYVFYARRVGDGTSVSGVYTSSSAAVPYLNADTVVAATSSTISNSATSATTKISAVDRATEEVAVRLNNGSTNIATRTGNGAITFSTSLPAAGTVTTYEIFTQRTVDTGGDGTTWYATDDTFTVGREVSAPTDIAFSPVIAYAENTDIIVTASGGTGGTLQVSDDNSTWVANGSSFGPYAKGSTVGPFYARRTSSVNNSASYSDSFTIPYDTPWTNYQVAEPYPVLGATTTQATIQVAVAVTYQDVAVRLNNGSTNLETVLAPTTSFVDIVIDNGLPGEEETLTYELFARLPVANGGDGTTWYQTNKTFTISRQSSIRVSPGQPISLLQVQTFVVDTGSAIITEYYRSPNGDVPALPQNSAVPLSGTISMDDFYGIESISAPAEFTRSIVINGSASLRDNSVFSGNNCNFAFPASGFKDHIDVPGTWRIFYKTSGGDFSTNRYIDHVESVVDFVTGDISGTASVIFGGTLSTANATEIRDFYGVATGTLTIPADCITMYRKA